MTKAKLAKNLLKRVLIKGQNFEWYEIDGKRDGECKRWRDNGQLLMCCYFKNGELDGEFKTWDKNEKLLAYYYYKNGELDGEHKSWYANGQLREHCYYKNGVKIKQGAII